MTPSQEVAYFEEANKKGRIFPEKFFVEIDKNPEKFYDSFFSMGYVLFNSVDSKQVLPVKEGDKVYISDFRIYPPNSKVVIPDDYLEKYGRSPYEIPLSVCMDRMERFKTPFPDVFFLSMDGKSLMEQIHGVLRLGLYDLTDEEDWLDSAMDEGRTVFPVIDGKICEELPRDWNKSIPFEYKEEEIPSIELSSLIRTRDFLERHLSEILLADYEYIPSSYYLRLDGKTSDFMNEFDALGLQESPHEKGLLSGLYSTPHTYFKVENNFVSSVKEEGLKWPIDFSNKEMPVLSVNQIYEIKMSVEIRNLPDITPEQRNELFHITNREYPYTDIPYLLELYPNDKMDERLCFYAVRNNPVNIYFVPPEMLSDRVVKANLLSSEAFVLNWEMRRELSDKLGESALVLTMEHFPLSLMMLKEEKMTTNVCKMAVEKDLRSLLDVPEKIRNETFCVNAVKYWENRLDTMHLDLIPSLSLFPTVCHMIAENVEKNLFAKPEITILDYFLDSYFQLPKEYRSTRMDVEALRQNPKIFFMIPYKERSPELCLYMRMNTTYFSTNPWLVEDTIPKQVTHGKNVYTFAKDLTEFTSHPFTFDELCKVYEGRPLKVANIEIDGKTYQNQLVKWNVLKETFEISLEQKMKEYASKRNRLKP